MKLDLTAPDWWPKGSYRASPDNECNFRGRVSIDDYHKTVPYQTVYLLSPKSRPRPPLPLFPTGLGSWIGFMDGQGFSVSEEGVKLLKVDTNTNEKCEIKLELNTGVVHSNPIYI